MSILPRKGILAVAAVIEIALSCAANGGENLAARQGLALRHLEPLLQVLAPHGILTGYRGPRGGYRLAREPSDISVEDILRSIGSMEDDSTRSLLPIGHC